MQFKVQMLGNAVSPRKPPCWATAASCTQCTSSPNRSCEHISLWLSRSHHHGKTVILNRAPTEAWAVHRDLSVAGAQDPTIGLPTSCTGRELARSPLAHLQKNTFRRSHSIDASGMLASKTPGSGPMQRLDCFQDARPVHGFLPTGEGRAENPSIGSFP